MLEKLINNVIEHNYETSKFLLPQTSKEKRILAQTLKMNITKLYFYFYVLYWKSGQFLLPITDIWSLKSIWSSGALQDFLYARMVVCKISCKQPSVCPFCVMWCDSNEKCIIYFSIQMIHFSCSDLVPSGKYFEKRPLSTAPAEIES